MKIHHVGFLVQNIQKSIDAFRALEFDPHEIIFDPDRDAQICFLTSNSNSISGGGGKVELIQPMQSSDLFPLLKKFRNTPYHFCYEVENLDSISEKLQSNGFLLFRKKSPAIAISSTAQVVFLIHTALGMIELVQLE